MSAAGLGRFVYATRIGWWVRVVGGGVGALAITLLPACTIDRAQGGEAHVVDVANVRASVEALAHDSLLGRRTGTPEAAKAARFIAGEMAELGLEPAGDDGYLQPLTLARTVVDGRERLILVDDAAADSVSPDRLIHDANVLGIIRGADPELRDEAVVVGAHYDHVGVGRAVDGDSIYNGADDDASGVVAVLEIARALKAGPPPRRSVVFAAFTAEEVGILGSVHYLEKPVVALEQTVAEIQIEMIGRPDPIAGGSGRAWITGHERSTVGDVITAEGLSIAADPRPDQRFFERSDNIVFAYRGVPAHTVSSFNMHTDYHRPSDEADRVDYVHMTEVIRSTAQLVRLLADGPALAWKPGGRPEPFHPAGAP